MNGQQPDDPYKAAIAIIQAVDHPNSPLQLVLGVDTLGDFYEAIYPS